MQTYEITYLISPNLSENELEQTALSIEKIIVSSGKITSQEKAEKIPLSYPIKKQKEAFFAFCELETEPENIIAIKETLEKEKNILRFIIIKKEAETEASAREKTPKKVLKIDGKTESEAPANKEKPTSIDEELDKILNE